MKDMLVIVPTRGRPGNVALQQFALRETRTTMADVLYAVDDDDPMALEYCAMDGISVAVGPRMRLGGTLNFHALHNVDDYEVIGFMGDDHRPRTPLWDFRVLDWALDTHRPNVVYPNDLLQGKALATSVFLPSRMVRAMGYMVPPELTHLYCDNAWMEMGRELGTLTYLDHVVVEHMHPAAGKAAMDAGYRECNAPAVDSADRAAFERWRDGGEMAAAVQRIREEYTT